MRFDKLTNRFQAALQDAQSYALSHNHQFIEPLHLLHQMLNENNGTVMRLLVQCGIDIETLKQKVKDEIDRLPIVEGTPGEVHISQDLAKVLNVCDRNKYSANHR